VRRINIFQKWFGREDALVNGVILIEDNDVRLANSARYCGPLMGSWYPSIEDARKDLHTNGKWKVFTSNGEHICTEVVIKDNC